MKYRLLILGQTYNAVTLGEVRELARLYKKSSRQYNIPTIIQKFTNNRWVMMPFRFQVR